MACAAFLAVRPTELAAFVMSFAVPRTELFAVCSLRWAAWRLRVAAAFLAAALRCSFVWGTVSLTS